MDFTTQLRIVLLLAGGLALLCIYVLGKRHGRAIERDEQAALHTRPPAAPSFAPVSEVDEDEFDTPAYLRRAQPARAARDGTRETLPSFEVPDLDSDWTPAQRVPESAASHAHDFAEHDEDAQDQRDDERDEELHDADDRFANQFDTQSRSDSHPVDHFSSRTVPASQATTLKTPPSEPATSLRIEPSIAATDFVDDELPSLSADRHEPMFVDAPSVAPISTRNPPDAIAPSTADAITPTDFATNHQASLEWQADQPPVPATVTDEVLVEHIDLPSTLDVSEPPTIPAQRLSPAPVLSDAVSTPAQDPAPPAPKAKPDALLAKRKIIALRLSIPNRVPGEQLLSLLQRENLNHGRFDIFHRLQGDNSVFSVASMVEPGSFDLRTIRDQQFPGVTLFMLLPGPLDGLIAWDQMYSCAQRLAHATDGVLQDERGQRLTSMAADRLREDVLDFQHLIGSVDIVSH